MFYVVYAYGSRFATFLREQDAISCVFRIRKREGRMAYYEIERP